MGEIKQQTGRDGSKIDANGAANGTPGGTANGAANGTPGGAANGTPGGASNGANGGDRGSGSAGGASKTETPRVVVIEDDAAEKRGRGRPTGSTRSSGSKSSPDKISAKDIGALLSLIFSILAASLPDQKYLDFGRNPPEEISLRDLWTIPDEEIALISEPAARMISRASSDVQKRIVKNWDMITLMIGVAGVIGLRGVRHYEIITAAKQHRNPIQSDAGVGAAQNNADPGAGGNPDEFWGRFR